MDGINDPDHLPAPDQVGVGYSLGERAGAKAASRAVIGKQERPCWKPRRFNENGTVVGWFGGWDPLDWCAPCRKRQNIHAEYKIAVQRLGSLKGSLWRLAKRAHAEVAAELDKAKETK